MCVCVKCPWCSVPNLWHPSKHELWRGALQKRHQRSSMYTFSVATQMLVLSGTVMGRHCRQGFGMCHHNDMNIMCIDICHCASIKSMDRESPFMMASLIRCVTHGESFCSIYTPVITIQIFPRILMSVMLHNRLGTRSLRGAREKDGEREKKKREIYLCGLSPLHSPQVIRPPKLFVPAQTQEPRWMNIKYYMNLMITHYYKS